jgi:hypothetical protein
MLIVFILNVVMPNVVAPLFICEPISFELGDIGVIYFFLINQFVLGTVLERGQNIIKLYFTQFIYFSNKLECSSLEYLKASLIFSKSLPE